MKWPKVAPLSMHVSTKPRYESFNDNNRKSSSDKTVHIGLTIIVCVSGEWHATKHLYAN